MLMPSPRNRLALVFLLCPVVASAGQADSSADDTAAIFKAAGFAREADGRYIRCREDPPTLSYRPGSIERLDLNGDGRDEAIVREGSVFCYGNTAEYFVLLAQGDTGWQRLLEGAGIPVVLDARHRGWPDIEVGGPGLGGFPVYRWNGSAYERPR